MQDAIRKYHEKTANEEINTIVDDITTEIVSNWFENTIPLNSPADKAHYIRDLLFRSFTWVFAERKTF